MKKVEKLNPELALGFTDRKGDELILKDRLIGIIKQNFQLYGFEPLETPGFEISENIGKFLPDEDRPMSGVFGFKDDKDWISLRYDLTAPLARYVGANFNNLSKPFKRYQVGTVWRNEKPGPGRFREFTQVDADIVGTKNILADAEVCILLADTLVKCGLNKSDFIIRVNNRKCLTGIFEWLKITDEKQIVNTIRVIDKMDRLGNEGVKSLLGKGRKDESGDFTKGVGLNSKQIKEIIDYINTDIDFFREAPDVSYDGISKIYDDGIKELSNFFNNTRVSEFRDQIVYSSSLVRGIEYYTGTIFEAELLFKVKNKKGLEIEFGSVGGGGRYDNLVSRFSKNDAPATGISIGLDRLLIAMQQKKNKKQTESNGPVVICVFDMKEFLASPGKDYDITAPYYKILSMLRSAGIKSEIYSGDGSIKAQMKYADKRNSPAVILYGENEAKLGIVTIKNLKAGKEASTKIENREDWRKNENVQETVKLEDLVNEIKKII